MPPSIQQSNAKHYKSDTVTEVKEYEGRRTSCPPRTGGRRSPTTPSSGRSATPRRRRERRLNGGAPHAHRRPDHPDRGRRVAAADRSDVRRPRPEVLLRLGRERRASWPDRRSPPADLDPIDAVLLTHEHHGDNLDTAGRALLPSADVVVTTASGCERLGGAAARARRPGRPHGSRRPGGRRSRSRPRRAVTARRSAVPSSATSSASRSAGTARRTGRCGSPATRCSTTACARSPTACGRHRAAPSRRRALSGHRAAALHDDRARRRRALPPRFARAPRSRSTTRAGSTSTRAERRSSASSRAPPRTSAGGSGGCPSGRRSR